MSEDNNNNAAWDLIQALHTTMITDLAKNLGVNTTLQRFAPAIQQVIRADLDKELEKAQYEHVKVDREKLTAFVMETFKDVLQAMNEDLGEGEAVAETEVLRHMPEPPYWDAQALLKCLSPTPAAIHQAEAIKEGARYQLHWSEVLAADRWGFVHRLFVDDFPGTGRYASWEVDSPVAEFEVYEFRQVNSPDEITGFGQMSLTPIDNKKED